MLQRSEIQKYIKNKKWQAYRETMKGQPTTKKLKMLCAWKKMNKNSKSSKVQVENYLNALTRGSLL